MPRRFTARDVARIQAGAKAGGRAARPRNTGAWLENALRDTHAAYATARIAKLEKVEPPVKVLHGPPKRIIMLVNPFLDFIGVWTARGGINIHAEAKSTSKDRLALGGEGGVSSDQLANLRAWKAAGAPVCVLWGYLDQVRYVSLALIEARLANGIKSVLWAHADPVPAGMGFIMHDWLQNLAAEYPSNACGLGIPKPPLGRRA